MSGRHAAANMLAMTDPYEAVDEAVNWYVGAMEDQQDQHNMGSDSGEGLRAYLLRQYKWGKLPANSVCTLA